MGLKTFFILAAFLATINVGTAIKCYVCAGSETSDCAKGKASAMSIVNCKAPGTHLKHRSYSYFNVADSDELEDSQFKAVCLKLVETDYQPKLFARGCGLFPINVDPCNFLQRHSHITNCKTCKTDLCNQRSEMLEDFSELNAIEYNA